jgi:hypothetical protein
MDTADNNTAVYVPAALEMAARPRRGADPGAFDFWPQSDLGHFADQSVDHDQ